VRTFVTQSLVRFSDTDAFGIVYYPNVFRLFDLAVEMFLRASPYDHMAELRATGAGFPALEASATFRSPIFAGDEIAIESDLEEVRTRAFRVRHRILRGVNVLATGLEVRMYARKPLGASAVEGLPLPEDLRAYLLGQ
jgi:YbgC/YbaW family acyl-CoA thioester hydrolase